MDKIDIEKYDPAVEPVSDKVHRLARASAASVPVVGGAIAEAVNAIVAPPYEARTNAWLHQLSNTLNALIENYNQSESQLSENEALLSAIVRSSDIAVRTEVVPLIRTTCLGVIFPVNHAAINGMMVS
ncbi:hypothetical protein [Cycloclasticus pugetii]|uniref:hypothetical protein n=1 Tax=Cycloclasticus pugetii TaxID=34068 RepID=UPI0009168FDA|nr:hypothetical protein [Cycloclasticus pugetii]SHI38236.1 hypothetical protein SAMN05519226_0126 [Cycloclasticus pugetii]